MTNKVGDIDEFRRLAATWGGDLARWPLDQRTAALDIAKTDEGREILAAENALDERLGELAAISAIDDVRSASVEERVLTMVAARRRNLQPRRLGWKLLVQATSGIAASALLGAFLGIVFPPPEVSGAPTLGFGDGVFLTPFGRQ